MSKIRYLIIGFPRSGTTVIHLLLKGHPNVAALNDVLKISPFFTEGISTFTFGKDLLEEKTNAYLCLFDAITSISANENTKALGAKCGCYSPIQAQSLVDTLQKYMKNVKIILIIRNDLVAQYGSGYNARKTGIYHSWYKNFNKLTVHKLKINKWVFSRYVVNYLYTFEILGRLYETHNVMQCIYENFVSKPAATQRKLFDFVNVPKVDVTWLDSKKVLPDPDQYIRNYSEMLGIQEKLRADFVNNNISPMIKTLTKIKSPVKRYREFNQW